MNFFVMNFRYKKVNFILLTPWNKKCGFRISIYNVLGPIYNVFAPIYNVFFFASFTIYIYRGAQRPAGGGAAVIQSYTQHTVYDTHIHTKRMDKRDAPSRFTRHAVYETFNAHGFKQPLFPTK